MSQKECILNGQLSEDNVANMFTKSLDALFTKHRLALQLSIASTA